MSELLSKLKASKTFADTVNSTIDLNINEFIKREKKRYNQMMAKYKEKNKL